MVKTSFEFRYSIMLLASAAPSSGSVPAPSSSNKTRSFFVTFSIIWAIFLMWAENVDNDRVISWCSSISEYTF